MTLLDAFWFGSLIVLVGILTYAYRRGADKIVTPDKIPESFADFIAMELSRMMGYLSHGAIYARPHGSRMLAQSRVFLEKGHNMFLERIFGRLDVEKGNVTSFFLKRIAEHKDALRKKDQGRA